MKKLGSSPLGLYMIGTAALFMAGFLTLVIFGAQTYRSTVGVQERNNRTRAALSYITAAVRAADEGGAVRIEEAALADGLKTPVLVLADGDTDYATRIYCFEGDLIEEYTKADAELSPKDGSVISRTEFFEVRKDGPLLHVRTDDGSILLHLRSEG